MEKIVVTTDFSGNSKAGIRFAIQLSNQLGYELIFYHVIEVMKPTSWNDKHYKKFASQLISNNTKKLEQFVEQICHENGIVKSNYQYIAEIGTEVKEMVIKQAKKVKAGYICMSTHGAGKIKKLFGTHASSLVTTSPIPVFVIPKNYRIKPITKIFYASDFAAIKKELDIVRNFAKPFKAVIEVYHYNYLLHVEEERKKLQRKADALKAPGVTFIFERQEVESTLATHLRDDIKRKKPSIVILFTKPNRNWFDRLFAKRESAEMTFNAKVPMLVFRKKTTRA